MPLYDCLIVGGGPAGLSTALGLCRALRSCVIFDDGCYRNWATSRMHTVSTWDHHRPEEYREKATAELLCGRYNSVYEISTSPVVSVKEKTLENKSNDKIFTIIDQNGVEWHGKTIVWASGVEDILPSSKVIPGFVEGWGQSIFHCLFCHGYEERGSPSAGILILSPGAFQFSVAFAGMTSKLAKKIIIYTNGLNLEEAEEETKGKQKPSGATSVQSIKSLLQRNSFEIDERPITKLVPHKTNIDKSHEDEPPKIDVYFSDNTKITHSFLVCRPDQRVRNRNLMEKLGVKFNEETGLAEVSSLMNGTDAPGVFVAGDNNTMYQQVTNAIYQGGKAAGGIHHFLISKELNNS